MITTTPLSLLRELNPDYLRTKEACCRCHQAGAFSSWPTRTRTWKRPGAKTRRVCHFPYRPSEPPSGADPDLALYKSAATAVYGGEASAYTRAVLPGILLPLVQT